MDDLLGLFGERKVVGHQDERFSLRVQLVDDLVGVVVARMLDLENIGVGRRLGLGRTAAPGAGLGRGPGASAPTDQGPVECSASAARRSADNICTSEEGDDDYFFFGR